MTQYQKDHIRDSILKIAKEEFMSNGFNKTSMRTIAKKSSVSLSNIYNYFRNKDELLIAVMKPILDLITIGKKQMEEHEKCHHRTDLEGHHEFILPAVDFVIENKEMLKLLAFKCNGSSLEKFREGLIEWYKGKANRIVEFNGNHHDLVNYDVADIVIKSIATFWINFITEIIQMDITLDEARKSTLDMMTFTHSGWHGLAEAKFTEHNKKPE